MSNVISGSNIQQDGLSSAKKSTFSQFKGSSSFGLQDGIDTHIDNSFIEAPMLMSLAPTAFNDFANDSSGTPLDSGSVDINEVSKKIINSIENPAMLDFSTSEELVGLVKSVPSFQVKDLMTDLDKHKTGSDIRNPAGAVLDKTAYDDLHSLVRGPQQGELLKMLDAGGVTQEPKTSLSFISLGINDAIDNVIYDVSEAITHPIDTLEKAGAMSSAIQSYAMNKNYAINKWIGLDPIMNILNEDVANAAGQAALKSEKSIINGIKETYELSAKFGQEGRLISNVATSFAMGTQTFAKIMTSVPTPPKVGIPISPEVNMLWLDKATSKRTGDFKESIFRAGKIVADNFGNNGVIPSPVIRFNAIEDGKFLAKTDSKILLEEQLESALLTPDGVELMKKSYDSIMSEGERLEWLQKVSTRPEAVNTMAPVALAFGDTDFRRVAEAVANKTIPTTDISKKTMPVLIQEEIALTKGKTLIITSPSNGKYLDGINTDKTKVYMSRGADSNAINIQNVMAATGTTDFKDFTNIIGLGGGASQDVARMIQLEINKNRSPGNKIKHTLMPALISQTGVGGVPLAVIKDKGIKHIFETDAPNKIVASISSIQSMPGGNRQNLSGHLDFIANIGPVLGTSLAGMPIRKGQLYAAPQSGSPLLNSYSINKIESLEAERILREQNPRMLDELKWMEEQNGDFMSDDAIRHIMENMNFYALNGIRSPIPASLIGSEHKFFDHLANRGADSIITPKHVEANPALVADPEGMKVLTHGETVAVGTVLTTGIHAELTGNTKFYNRLRQTYEHNGLPLTQDVLDGYKLDRPMIEGVIRDVVNDSHTYGGEPDSLMKRYFKDADETTGDWTILDRIFPKSSGE